MQYFMISLRYENFQQIKNNSYKLVGFPNRCKMIESAEPGDKFILYVGSGKSLITGIIEATGKVFWDNEMLWDDIFPKRIETKEYIILPYGSYVYMKEIKNGLSFINPEVKKFGVYFMNGLRKLSEEDYNYILEKTLIKLDELS